MNRSGGYLAAIFVIFLGVVLGDGPVRASSTVTGLPGSKALSSMLAKASDALDEIRVEVPEDVPPRDVLLLALNVYYEARGEGITGKAAVAHVTLNRVKDGRWPPSLSAVIMQPGQFSWTRNPPKIEDWDALKASVVVAAKAMSGKLKDRTGGALYFHAARLGEPEWAQGLTRLSQIGSHTFYAD